MNIPATPLRKLPIEIHSFEKLRSEGYLYVDKTAIMIGWNIRCCISIGVAEHITAMRIWSSYPYVAPLSFPYLSTAVTAKYFFASHGRIGA